MIVSAFGGAGLAVCEPVGLEVGFRCVRVLDPERLREAL